VLPATSKKLPTTLIRGYAAFTFKTVSFISVNMLVVDNKVSSKVFNSIFQIVDGPEKASLIAENPTLTWAEFSFKKVALKPIIAGLPESTKRSRLPYILDTLPNISTMRTFSVFIPF